MSVNSDSDFVTPGVGPRVVSKPPTDDPEEFMAILLHAQANPCSCPSNRYFKKLGTTMIEKRIKVKEVGRKTTRRI